MSLLSCFLLMTTIAHAAATEVAVDTATNTVTFTVKLEFVGAPGAVSATFLSNLKKALETIYNRDDSYYKCAQARFVFDMVDISDQIDVNDAKALHTLNPEKHRLFVIDVKGAETEYGQKGLYDWWYRGHAAEAKNNDRINDTQYYETCLSYPGLEYNTDCANHAAKGEALAYADRPAGLDCSHKSAASYTGYIPNLETEFNYANIAHEIGHILGAGHVQSTNKALMNATHPTTFTTKDMLLDFETFHNMIPFAKYSGAGFAANLKLECEYETTIKDFTYESIIDNTTTDMTFDYKEVATVKLIIKTDSSSNLDATFDNHGETELTEATNTFEETFSSPELTTVTVDCAGTESDSSGIAPATCYYEASCPISYTNYQKGRLDVSLASSYSAYQDQEAHPTALTFDLGVESDSDNLATLTLAAANCTYATITSAEYLAITYLSTHPEASGCTVTSSGCPGNPSVDAMKVSSGQTFDSLLQEKLANAGFSNLELSLQGTDIVGTNPTSFDWSYSVSDTESSIDITCGAPEGFTSVKAELKNECE